MTPQAAKSQSRIRLAIALLTVTALVTAACGSTLDPEAQELLQTGAGSFALPEGATVTEEGEILNEEGEVIGTVEEGLFSGSGGSLTSSGSSGGAVTASGDTQGSSDQPDNSAGEVPKFGPGVTDSTIKVGWPENNDARGGCEVLGSCHVIPNTEGQWEWYIKWINEHGGIAGRKLEPVKYEYNRSESTTNAALEQRICTYFTEDHPVFAVFADGSPNFIACLNRAGVSVITGLITQLDAELMAEVPYYYVVNGLNMTAVGAISANGFVKSGCFSSPKKTLGVVAWDNPQSHRALEEGFKPGLAKHGLEVSEEVYVDQRQSRQDLARSQAQLANAVLRFKTEGITNVTIQIPDLGTETLLFMENAEEQDYYPQYCLMSANAAPVVYEVGATSDRSFEGLHAVGWYPPFDVSTGQEFTPPPGWTECKQRWKGSPYGTRSNNEFSNAGNRCDYIAILKAGIEAGLSKGINAESMRLGVDSLGRQPPASAITYATYFSPATHDAATSYRISKFVSECSCMRVFGPIVRFR